MKGMIQQSRRSLGIPDKTVSITFDDGPVPNQQTNDLLDILEAEQVVAGFCLVGARIPGNESVVKRIFNSGHVIVNHGYSHLIPNRLSDAEFLEDIKNFDRAVGDAVSIPDWTSQYYRPPGGQQSERLLRLLEQSQHVIMPMSFFAWDVFPIPWQKKLILAALLKDLKKNQGGLYMLHEATVPLSGEKIPIPPRDNRAWMVELIGDFITAAKQDDFRFVSPAEIICHQ